MSAYRSTAGKADDETISVIICCYTEERWALLAQAIHSAFAQTRAPTEVIVIVDYNPDLLDRVREAFPQVVAIPNTEVKGLSGARNAGITRSCGDILVFLDDDAVAELNFVDLLTRAMREPLVLGVGGHAEPIWDVAPPRWLPQEFYWIIGCSHRGLPTDTRPVRNVLGGAMAVKRHVFSTAGGFRSDLGRVGAMPFGCEETEFCIRVARTHGGGRFLLEPSAVIRHFVPRRRLTWDYFKSRCLAEGYSKAFEARLVGVDDALASERSYVLRVLPLGVALGLWQTVKGDISGLARAAAIVCGLVLTAIGYVRGLFSRDLRQRAAIARRVMPITDEA